MSAIKLIRIITIFIFIAYTTTFNYGGCSESSKNSTTGGSSTPSIADYLQPTANVVSPYAINLTWNRVLGNEGYYNISYRRVSGINPDSSYISLATVSYDTISYLHSGLTPNTWYTYDIYAYYADGRVAQLGQCDATTPLE